ncbi:MAG TPA: hypothetical protein VN892_18390 [Solirubrobacteraceae bacterium]|nr:hypothetical protein [Solirubrobacteraceae bacterium]
MQLTHQALLPYQGFHGTQGLCHLRVYEQPGRLPIVIAGALDDNPATSITNAIEMVAAAIQASVITDGREFELIEHYPASLADKRTPTFSRVRFAHRTIDEDPDDPTHYAGTLLMIDGEKTHVTRGRPICGDFRDPSWESIADIEQLLGCEVNVWRQGDYTARAVAGEQGQQLRNEVAEQTTAATRQLIDAIEPDE